VKIEPISGHERASVEFGENVTASGL
jgi:hypothetical protein